MRDEIEEEIERLKMKKVEIVSKINLANSFDEKEEHAKDLEIIQKQIEVLEKLKIK